MRALVRRPESGVWGRNLLSRPHVSPPGVQGQPSGQPLTYDFGLIKEDGVTTSSDWFSGAVHHVMARADRREEIFRGARDRWKFLGYLARLRHLTSSFAR